MQITVTVNPDIWAVRLEASAAVGQVDWVRRTGGRDEPVGSGTLVWDYTGELNRSYTYIATDDVDTEVSAPTTVTSDRPVLSSTTSPMAVQVDVVDQRPLFGQGRSVWHPVLGRNDPFVTVHPALYPSGLLRLSAPTPTVRGNLIDLLTRGEPLSLRTTCPDRVSSMVFLMLSWSDPFTRTGRKGGPAYLEIDFQQVTEAPGILPPAPDRTYATILAEHTSYADVAASYATYRDLLDGVRVP